MKKMVCFLEVLVEHNNTSRCSLTGSQIGWAITRFMISLHNMESSSMCSYSVKESRVEDFFLASSGIFQGRCISCDQSSKRGEVGGVLPYL
uniref:Uncharacterized protein n=1 Tax=Lotus japonicus TaxID=34305 RepID=I3T5C4_LOTJA|nr:unknown [Lotus japonicus]